MLDVGGVAPTYGVRRAVGRPHVADGNTPECGASGAWPLTVGGVAPHVGGVAPTYWVGASVWGKSLPLNSSGSPRATASA